jgi:hypothetical protein
MEADSAPAGWPVNDYCRVLLHKHLILQQIVFRTAMKSGVCDTLALACAYKNAPSRHRKGAMPVPAGQEDWRRKKAGMSMALSSPDAWRTLARAGSPCSSGCAGSARCVGCGA